MRLEDAIMQLVDERIDQRLAQLRATLTPSPESSGLLTLAAVAAELDTTAKALSERFRRARRHGEPHPLEAMRIVVDGTHRWRRADVAAFVATLAEKTGAP